MCKWVIWEPRLRRDNGSTPATRARLLKALQKVKAARAEPDFEVVSLTPIKKSHLTACLATGLRFMLMMPILFRRSASTVRLALRWSEVSKHLSGRNHSPRSFWELL